MTQLSLNPKELKALESRNISQYEQLVRLVPRVYYDCRYENGLNIQYAKKYCCIIGVLSSISVKEMGKSKNNKTLFLIQASVMDRITKKKLHISWFNRYDIFKDYRYAAGRDFLVYGQLNYDNVYGFSMNQPIIFSDDIQEKQQIIPEYGKIKGITPVLLEKALLTMQYYKQKEYLPIEILQKCKLPTINEVTQWLHSPTEKWHIQKAYQRLLFDDMLYFAISMKLKTVETEKKPVFINSNEKVKHLVKHLPFQLTKDQADVVEKLEEMLRNGKPINALIQGDVGCGKTITTLLTMMLTVENGYQAALMAPTDVLASQHFQEIAPIVEELGYQTVYLNGNMTAKQKREAYSGIADGTYQFIIGTHALAAESVEYKNLGLIAIDEEHKFGVNVKEALKEKSPYHVPYITLSATPIPRSIGELIYGDYKQIFEIRSMPDGRKQVDTQCFSSFDVPPIVDSELEKGHQVYVVCPQIEKDIEPEKGGMKRHSVEEVKELYERHFASRPDIRIGSLTGKRSGKKIEGEDILQQFKDGKIQILIATTVIEVGVNNPNATVIVIQDADCYGLATMHQLRGRVKRGNYQPYCVLVSPNGKSNPRLEILCNTGDGFKIAEADFKMRQSGNLIGLEQSGKNKYIDYITAYPNMYQFAKRFADWMIAQKKYSQFIEYMEKLEE